MTRRPVWAGWVLGLIALLTVPFAVYDGRAAASANSADTMNKASWVGSWGTAMAPPGSAGTSREGFSDRTLRMVTHLSTGGSKVRLRFSNVYGERPLDLGAVTVARRAEGAEAVPGTRRPVAFHGERATTVPVGAEAVSDPVELPVKGATDLLVSVHLPTPTGPTTWHPWAKQTGYASTDGDHTADDGGGAYPEKMTSWFFLEGVDVSTDRAAGTVVAFGDSLTEGGVTADDGNRRWPDLLAGRLAQLPPHERLSVVNTGLGGNRLLTDAGPVGGGDNNLGRGAESRFTRDVPMRTGASDVIMSFGNNDLGSDAGVHPGERLTPSQLVAGFGRLASRAHAAGLAVHVATVTPNGKLDARAERIRTEVNRWIRAHASGGPFDSVIDFDAAVRDPGDPHRLRPAYDSGDTVHPNDAGLRAMAATVDLGALTGGAGAR